MIGICKWLLIGDSLMVGFRILPNQENHAVVGRAPIGVLKTLDSDLAKCGKSPVVLAIGSNVMYNNHDVEFEHISQIVEKVKKSNRSLIIMPVPAQGKHRKAADKFNQFFKSIPGVTIIPLLEAVKKNLFKDNIHLRRSAYRIWLKQLNEVRDKNDRQEKRY